jgi:hypothetical protein
MKFNVAISTSHPNARPMSEFHNTNGMLLTIIAPDPGVAKEDALDEALKNGITDAQVIGVRLISRTDV